MNNIALMKFTLFSLMMLIVFGIEGQQSTSLVNQVYFSSYVELAGKKLNYDYAITRQNNLPITVVEPREAIIAIHGYPHDVLNTLNAVYNATSHANKANVLLVAPIFQVTELSAKKCAITMQKPQPDDLQWTCSSWISGDLAMNSHISSFQALDSLVIEIIKQWPTVIKITIVGFSAGGQMVQHYIGFSTINTIPNLDLHYVIADPGTWLYFDNLIDRYPDIKSYLNESVDEIVKSCPAVNSWKYGLENLPPYLSAQLPDIKKQYQMAKISYLEGELDNGNLPGAYFHILDKSCAANAQGYHSRLQRGKIYMAYLKGKLNITPTFSIVPNCAHDINCILVSEAGINALFH